MTKRAKDKFKRNPRDLYDTPESAVVPLISHLKFAGIKRYHEPCLGNGALRKALGMTGFVCDGFGDIAHGIDARSCDYDLVHSENTFITNPPWTREILHPIIENLRKQAPTWLLFDADWMHTKQAIPYLKHCSRIVSVGRVSWMGNGVSGYDNCCWYLFGDGEYETVFYGRVE